MPCTLPLAPAKAALGFLAAAEFELIFASASGRRAVPSVWFSVEVSVPATVGVDYSTVTVNVSS